MHRASLRGPDGRLPRFPPMSTALLPALQQHGLARQVMQPPFPRVVSSEQQHGLLLQVGHRAL